MVTIKIFHDNPLKLIPLSPLILPGLNHRICLYGNKRSNLSFRLLVLYPTGSRRNKCVDYALMEDLATLASLNEAISHMILHAVSAILMASAAPVPSPNLILKSIKGAIPM